MALRERQALPDALRALALVSVLVMNATGYGVAPWGPQLGLRTPDASAWAAAVQGLAGALLQGKGYSMLAFVFGMALWLSARGRSRADAFAHGLVRNRRLLRLGVVHGAFIYFGDILTTYALVGRLLLRRLHAPWRVMRWRLWWALALAVVSKLALIYIIVSSGPLQDTDERSMAGVRGVIEFLRLNTGTYVMGQVAALVVAAPVMYFCMLGGVAAARIKLLTHRRWRPALRRYAVRIAWVVLPLTLVYGWACAVIDPTDALRPWADSMGEVIVLPLASLYLVALGLASAGGTARWCQRLVPLGQRTLTLYVGHSVLCVFLWSGLGLGLQWTTVQVVGWCLALWFVAWGAATLSGKRRWPLEAWMGRR